jgi:RNA polymerase sigma-70 factor (ECF subfamily)
VAAATFFETFLLTGPSYMRKECEKEMPATKSNNHQEMVQFITENQNRFYLFAYGYVRNQDTALDMVQEAVYKALKSSESLINPTQMKPWFYRILVNVCIDEIRKTKHAVSTDPASLAELEQDLNAGHKDANVSQAELMDLHEILNRLEPKAKTIIALRYFEDMKLADVAEVLGTNISTVKSILYRTLDLLKVELKGDVF